MKLRIKFYKIGSMKFISHLDLMRYMQKAFRRAGVDVAYSQGYSPHQLLSFAAPLGLGDTSEGDYLDVQVNGMGDKEQFLDAVNLCMNEEIQFLSLSVHEDKEKSSMALVAAADYCVNIRSGYTMPTKQFYGFMEQEQIRIVKKTKRSEKEVDIRPMIYYADTDLGAFRLRQMEEGEAVTPKQEIFQKGLRPYCYLRTACGSSANLKPDLVMEAYCKFIGVPYQPFAFQIHRLETYADRAQEGEKRKLETLGENHYG